MSESNNQIGHIIGGLAADISGIEKNGFDVLTIGKVLAFSRELSGAALAAGFPSLSGFAGKLAFFMEGFDGRTAEDLPRFTELMKNCIEWIRLAATGSPDEKLEQTRESLEMLLTEGFQKIDSTPALPKMIFRVRVSFDENCFSRGIDPMLILDDLTKAGEIIDLKLDRSQLPEFNLMNPEKCFLGFEINIKTVKTDEELRDIFILADRDAHVQIDDVSQTFGMNTSYGAGYLDSPLGEILIERGFITVDELNDVLTVMSERNVKSGELIVNKGYATKSAVDSALHEQQDRRTKLESETFRLEASRLESLMNVLGEIIIGQTVVARVAEELESNAAIRLKNALQSLDRSTRGLQEEFMRIRMVPVAGLFEKLERFAAGIASSSGVDIEIGSQGGGTEIDRMIINPLYTALQNISRNVIALNLKKDVTRGQLQFKAYSLEGNVFVEIADNGSTNWIESTSEHNTTFKDLQAVHSALNEFNGLIDVFPGDTGGTRYRVKVPLSLAIIEGMLVRVGKERYIFPLLSIVESLQPKRDEVKTIEGKGEVILVRGEYVSLVRLYDLFGIKSDIIEPWKALVMIVEAGKQKVGVMIDDLIGQQQIVVKSLQEDLTNSRAVSGAAVLGDGDVALIIDVHGLVRQIAA